MDPHTAVSSGVNKTTAVDQTLNTSVGEWLHPSEIGGPTRLNDIKMAEDMCEAGDFGPGRENEYPSAAARGIKQFWYCKATTVNKVVNKEERGVETKAELMAQEAAEVRDSMSVPSAAPKKRPRADKSADSPRVFAAKKMRKDVMNQRGSSLRS